MRTELFKNMLTGLPLLSFRRFSLARFFAASLLSLLVCSDRKPGSGYGVVSSSNKF